MHDIKKVYSWVELLLCKYDALFQNGLGTLKDIQAKLVLALAAVPKFFKTTACALRTPWGN